MNRLRTLADYELYIYLQMILDYNTFTSPMLTVTKDDGSISLFLNSAFNSSLGPR